MYFKHFLKMLIGLVVMLAIGMGGLLVVNHFAGALG
jgi:hypothetical protein